MGHSVQRTPPEALSASRWHPESRVCPGRRRHRAGPPPGATAATISAGPDGADLDSAFQSRRSTCAADAAGAARSWAASLYRARYRWGRHLFHGDGCSMTPCGLLYDSSNRQPAAPDQIKKPCLSLTAFWMLRDGVRYTIW